MYNLAVRGHDISDVCSIESLSRKIADLGIHTLQLAMGKSFPKLVTPSSKINIGLAQTVRREFARNQIDIGILSCYVNLIHPDLELREDLLQTFETYLKYASYFGAGMVASETGGVDPEIHFTVANYSEEAFLEVLKIVKRLAVTAEKFGVQLAIEPGLNHPIHSLEKTGRLIDLVASDFLTIILDPTNLITVENYRQQAEIVEEAFQLFGDKIQAFHLKDFIIKENEICPVNLFEGQIEVEKLLSIVEKYKPGCMIVMEETKDKAIRAALDKLKF